MCLSAILSAITLKRVTAMVNEGNYPMLTMGDSSNVSDSNTNVYFEAPTQYEAPNVVSVMRDEPLCDKYDPPAPSYK